ncbi:MAG: hypothetical protein ACTMHL_13140 [Janibacter sp.]
MRRIRTWSTAAAVVLAGVLVVTLSPSDGSEAQWRDSDSTSVSGPRSDTFEMTAADVPDNRATPWPNGRMATSPQITLKNQSTRHSSWVNVKSSRVTNVIGNDGTGLLGKLSLDYTVGSGSCETGGQGQYWRAGGFGQLTNGTTITRSQTKVDGATLPSGQSRLLCPKVGLDYASTTAGQRSALLNHAGRAVDITTVVNQRSEAPATWASSERTVTSRYRLAMPTPVKPSRWNVCRTTTSGGDPDSILPKYYGGLFWGWPNADTANFGDPTSTPAMAGGWDVMRRTRAGAWEVWKSVAAGEARALAGINSREISDERHEVRDFKLRGYPFAGDKSRYVESAWIARAENDWSLLTDRWQCHDPLPNPDAGPHNLP